MRNLLGNVLGIVNSGPPSELRQEFYAIKDHVLRRFGRRVGQDIQHIVKPCWHCRRWNCDDCDAFDSCCKCLGTDIYLEFWSRLDVYQIGKHCFHLPVERIKTAPAEPVTITGYIQHVERGSIYKRKELCLWLILLFDPMFLLSRIHQLGYVKVSPRFPLFWLLSQIGRIRWTFERGRERFKQSLTPRFERDKKEKQEDIPF